LWLQLQSLHLRQHARACGSTFVICIV
jgi:hypothetical protein